MAIEEEYKEVYFHKYCKTCKFEKVSGTEDPCNECLGRPTNVNTHKPYFWKEKE